MIGALKRGQSSGFRGRLSAMLVAVAVAALGLPGQAPIAQAQGAGASQTAQPSTGTEECVRPRRVCLDPDLTIALKDETVTIEEPEVITVVVRNDRPDKGDAGLPAAVAAGARLFSLPFWGLGLHYTAFRAPAGYTCTQPAGAGDTIDCAATAPQQIAPGERLEFSLTMAYRPRTVVPRLTSSLSATVDPDNRVAERNESNNGAAATLEIRGPALVMLQITSEGATTYGSDWSSLIRVTNRGNRPARLPAGVTVIRTAFIGLRPTSFTPPRGIQCTTNTSSASVTSTVTGVPTVFEVVRGTTDCRTSVPLQIRPGETLEFRANFIIRQVPGQHFDHEAFVNPDGTIPSLWWQCATSVSTGPTEVCMGPHYGGGIVDF